MHVIPFPAVGEPITQAELETILELEQIILEYQSIVEERRAEVCVRIRSGANLEKGLHRARLTSLLEIS